MEEKKREEREEKVVLYEDMDKSIFETEEIVIEEMAIDGICGVY